MYLISCADNLEVKYDTELYSVIFADYVYESTDFSWIVHSWDALQNGGVLIAMTDYHSVFELGHYMKNFPNARFVNHLVWKNEWGNHPKDRFHQCFDDILIFSKGKHNKFYSDRVQIPKATVNTRLNPSGRKTKTATAFVDDICLTTTSKERIKLPDGHLVRWQKPLKLMDRLLLPFTDAGDYILDLFMGSGTVVEWAILNGRYCVGYENNPEIFKLAVERLKKYKGENKWTGCLPAYNE